MAARDIEPSGREQTISTREKQAAARDDAPRIEEAGYSNQITRLQELIGGIQ